MKPSDNIKNFFKSAAISTNPRMDQTVFEEVLTAQEKMIEERSAKFKPNIWRIIMKSRFTKFAAAAVVIIAICFFFTRQDRNKEIKPQQITQTANSPAEMLTMASLNLAYRHGGMEAAEMQSQKAFKMIGVVKSNIKQLQEELINNNGI